MVPVLIWFLVCRYSNVFGDSDEHFVPPMNLTRRLHSSDTASDVEHGFQCLSESEKYDHDTIQLRMVRKYHVTMGGLPGQPNVCLSGEGPCLRKGTEWALLLYLPGMFYMFVAIAIVCDEFFVPSLEMFVEEYEISMDVAGATFMAAGGSMPELFMSFIATFDETDVGMSTIVGSAVFNVLFVIAVCAMASTEPLELTWWPLARDCTFYLLGLCLIVVFFKGISPQKIELWEALVMFLWYLIYCSFMKINGRANAFVQGKIDSFRGKEKQHLAAQTEDNAPEACSRCSQVNLRMPSQFRSGIVQMFTQQNNISETVGMAAVTHLKGNLKELYCEIDSDNDGFINESEFKLFMEKLGWKTKEEGAQEQIDNAWITISRDQKITFEMFSKWYTVSEARVDIEVRKVFNHFDRDGDGTIDCEEVRQTLKELGHRPSDDSVKEIMVEMAKSDDLEESTGATLSKHDCSTENLRIDFELFSKWYQGSSFVRQHREKNELEAQAEEGGFTIDWPPEDATYTQLFWYFFTYPLCSAMYCSLPDIRRPGMEGKVMWAIIEFLMSLVWIGVFTQCLYECSIVVCNTISIPPPVAGVTVLAAGTSIPDLLSSYIVARQGEGDMAVSSSIGSNLFDITVGLPVPWTAFIIAKSIETKSMAHVTVQSGTIFFSVLLLIFMLASVILTVVCMKWRMTRPLGGVMLFLYVIFIIQDLLQQLPKNDPILKINF
eukprot:TRINITY_DN8319_c0_g2_i1.p1 TRINITY_DN8319_c0_g2~~TRINITY_DN8319_c0_g2_i1.p1  ORF type:complete len:817 (+),score=128.10 TRINITY_DN8319_c0_g2_i1:298-2451(+)